MDDIPAGCTKAFVQRDYGEGMAVKFEKLFPRELEGKVIVIPPTVISMYKHVNYSHRYFNNMPPSDGLSFMRYFWIRVLAEVHARLCTIYSVYSLHNCSKGEFF